MTAAAITTARASLPAVTAAASNLIRDSIAPNTRRAYESAMRQLDAWGAGRKLDDAALADYLGKLDIDGRSPASAAMVIAAVRMRARLTGESDPVGPAAERAYKGFRRNGRMERGRGQAPALDLDAIADIAAKCSPLDRAIVTVLFQAGLRRSEAAALEWRDVEPGAAANTYRVTVRASKTNQDGAPDVRFIKNGAGRALGAIRPDNAQPTDSVFGLSGQSIGRRFSAAARRAGFRATAHSARVTLASELTRLGASAQEVMKAGAWKTSRMVAHYSAGVDAEAGAVAKYL